MKIFDAKGTEGFLLIYPDFSSVVLTEEIRRGKPVLACNGTVVVFRVYEYDENGKHKKNEDGHAIFKDYKINHHDLKVKLLDGQFYETNNGNFIDYPNLRYEDECKASNTDSP